MRLVRALGAHRYVAGRLHAVHALAFDAASVLDPSSPSLRDACAWAGAVLGDPSVERDSKDPRLFREATPDELLAVLEAFWAPGPSTDRVHDRLLDRAHELELPLSPHAPFDEEVEDEMHPVLVDAGWELLPLAELDPERHRGVIEAYGEAIQFEAARFEEETAIPRRRYLHELPALGLVELLRGIDGEGALVEPLVLWTDGEPTYDDYVLRGVLRAAKLT